MASVLKKHFGFYTLLIYGIGDILGAGIYALIGKVAGEAGTYAWLSFAIALVVAVLTALSYSELCARFPKSGGVSYFAERAFSGKWISFMSGWILACACIFSIATLGIAFVGYLGDFNFEISKYIIILIFLLALGLINYRGIEHSSTANIIATVIEVSGLVFVIYAALNFIGDNPDKAPSSSFVFTKIIEGAALAFFAFIGFEDLANVAEEVKDPEKNIPRAILTAVVFTGSFYVFLAWLSTQVVTPNQLANSSASLTEVIKVSGYSDFLTYFSIIALFAVSNTCLLNSVTASRLLYGMSEQKLMPKFLNQVHAKFKTPYYATAIVLVIAYAITFLGDLKDLAGVTSFLVLIAFTIANVSLVVIKRKKSQWTGFRVPFIIPYIAIASNLALIFFIPIQSIYILLGVLALGLILKKILIR